VWETNVFGALAVYQTMLPLLRESSDARIANVSSGVGSLTTNADPAHPYHASYGPVYPASKAALNAITPAMMIELESTGIKINLVPPGFTTIFQDNVTMTFSEQPNQAKQTQKQGEHVARFFLLAH